MTDLYVVLAFAALSAAVFAFPARRSRWWRLAAVPLVVLTLGLALRFCGRTYPGVAFDSVFLNDLLNGSGLFTEAGYDLAVAFGVADAVFVVLTAFRGRGTSLAIVRSLVALRLALLVFVLLILAYGFYFAVVFWEHWTS